MCSPSHRPPLLAFPIFDSIPALLSLKRADDELGQVQRLDSAAKIKQLKAEIDEQQIKLKQERARKLKVYEKQLDREYKDGMKRVLKKMLLQYHPDKINSLRDGEDAIQGTQEVRCGLRVLGLRPRHTESKRVGCQVQGRRIAPFTMQGFEISVAALCECVINVQSLLKPADEQIVTLRVEQEVEAFLKDVTQELARIMHSYGGD
jgi:hypothetical protein